MHVRRTQDFGEHKTTCMQPAEFGLCVGIGYFQKASKRLKVSHKHWSWDLRMFIKSCAVAEKPAAKICER